MGRPQFDDSWKNAFDGAETDVPESVWSKIEIDLIRTENKNSKTLVILYQRMAAGIALFALSLAGYIAYDRLMEGNIQISRENVLGTTEQTAESMQENSSLRDPNTASKNERSETQVASNNTLSANSVIAKPQLAKTSLTSAAMESEDFPLEQLARYRQRTDFIPDLLAWRPSEIKLQRTKFYEPNFPRQLPEMPSFLMASNNQKSKDSDSFFASVGLAGGSYNPGGMDATQSNSIVAQADSPSFLANSAQPHSMPASTGSAFSMGMSIGKKVSKRWMLQTGLNYINQSIDYTSNYTAISSNRLSLSVAEYSALESGAISYVNPYTIRSAVEFLGIPVQAGYQIVDRKLGLQLNAGVSTDFFLNNTLRDESGQSDDFSQGAGEASPYRTVNWSGLMGFEISYKLASRYSMSILPGLRYTFNSILKDETNFTYKPVVLDVGLRVRYLFK